MPHKKYKVILRKVNLRGIHGCDRAASKPPHMTQSVVWTTINLQLLT